MLVKQSRSPKKIVPEIGTAKRRASRELRHIRVAVRVAFAPVRACDKAFDELVLRALAR